jgi:hypothetical protein
MDKTTPNTDRRNPANDPLRRLALVGNLMAAQLLVTAEALDASDRPEPNCIERRLIELWEKSIEEMLADMRAADPRAVGRHL